jgi:hypothetical protein
MIPALSLTAMRRLIQEIRWHGAPHGRPLGMGPAENVISMNNPATAFYGTRKPVVPDLFDFGF